MSDEHFLFPRWTNRFLAVLGLLVLGGLGYGGGMFMLATDPVTLNVGYEPTQPVPFSHAIHAGQLKMDCRYCHSSVEKAAHASVPATQTCINCHSPMSPEGAPVLTAVHSDSSAAYRKLRAVHDSWRSGESIPWKRIHRLPDFVYFNHAAHVNRGVSCVTCHDRIDKMEVVYQAKELSMTWCVDCHRNPEPHLRPAEYVTQLDWKAETYLQGLSQEQLSELGLSGDESGEAAAFALGKRLKEEHGINPRDNCAVCHR
jgi:hypothetical protein